MGSRRARAWLAAAGVGTCTLLVLALAAAFHSVEDSMASYAGQRAVDLWVTAPGSDNLIRGSPRSLIPLEFLDSVRTVAGVAEAQPVLEAFLPVTAVRAVRDSSRLTLLAIGYKVPGGLAGPPLFAVGRAPRGLREVALDRVAAWRFGIGVGDTVFVAGRRLRVAGLTRGTNILATQFLFADFDAAAIAAGAPGKASFLVARLAPRAAADSVAHAIEERFPALQAFSRARFLANNQREVTAGFLPLLGLIAILGIVAAAVLVGLLLHGVVEERRGDIAVLLALGADVESVGVGMIAHALGLVALGVVAGSAGAWALAAILDRMLPVVPLAVSARDAIAISLLFLMAGLIAALVPVFSLRHVDPLEAFRP
jgi:putative ABC transport system permease protein